MRIRRILGLVTVAVLLMFVLAACGSSNISASASSIEKGTETLTESLQTEQEDTSGAETDGNVLIAYFSYTGNTEEAAQMIATFLAENDFSGKTIIPFCTSASDDIGNSLHIFSELCPDAEIAEGLTANDLDDIEPWLQGLGLMD